MKTQPDMAKMPPDYPPATWREYAHDTAMLLAAIMGGIGFVAVAACIQEWMK